MNSRANDADSGVSRRAVLGALTGTGAGLAGCFGLDTGIDSTTETPPEDVETWPSVGYDSANTGHNPDGRGPNHSTERWRYRIGEAGQAAPVVGWTVTGLRVAVWGHDAGLNFLDVESGAKIDTFWPGEGWKEVRIPGAPAAGAFDKGTVYVSGGGLPSAPFVYAYRTGVGEVPWQFQTGNRNVHSPITITDTAIYVGTASSSPRLYAIDATRYDEFTGTGIPLWQRDVDGTVEGAPAASPGRVFVGTDSGSVHAFDAGDGAERWTASVDGAVRSAPAVADGTVTVGCTDGNVYMLGLERGEERGRAATGVSRRTQAVKSRRDS